MARSLAVAYQMKKKAKGGRGPSSGKSGFAGGGEIKGVHKDRGPYSPKGVSEAGRNVRADRSYHASGRRAPIAMYKVDALKEHKKVLGQIRSGKGPTSGKSGFALGGKVKKVKKHDEPTGVHRHAKSDLSKGTSRAGAYLRYAGESGGEMAKDEHQVKLRQLKKMKGPTSGRSGFAEGGQVDAGCPKCGYSEGGRVANDTDMSAGQCENEFDYLVLHDDIVSKAMRRRQKRG